MSQCYRTQWFNRLICTHDELNPKTKKLYKLKCVSHNEFLDKILRHYTDLPPSLPHLLCSPHQHCQTSAANQHPPTPTMTAMCDMNGPSWSQSEQAQGYLNRLEIDHFVG